MKQEISSNISYYIKNSKFYPEMFVFFSSVAVFFFFFDKNITFRHAIYFLKKKKIK